MHNNNKPAKTRMAEIYTSLGPKPPAPGEHFASAGTNTNRKIPT